MKNSIYIIVLVVNCFCPAYFAQTIKIQDSLKMLLSEEQDTEQYHILKQLAWSTRNTNPAEAIFYGKKAANIAELYNMDSEKAVIQNYIGIFRRNQNYYTEALNHFFTALSIADSLNQKVEIAYAHNNIGDIYRRLNIDTLAIRNFEKALDIFTEIKQERGMAYCYNQLTLLYINVRDYEKALEYNHKSVGLRKQINDWVGIASNYRNSGDIYLKKNDFVMAEAYYKKALEIDKNLNEIHGMAFTYNHIGHLLNLQNKHKEAINNLIKGIEIGETLKSYLVINNSAFELSLAYEKLGDTDKAYKYYKLYKQTGDSLYNQDNAKNITQLTMQFEFDKKQLAREEKNQQKLRKQKLMQILTLTGLLLTLIIAFLSYRSYQIKRRANKLLSQKNQQINEQKEELMQINAQLQKSQNELNEAINMKNQFFSIIAHDLRTPFNTIFGFTRLLYKDIEEFDSNTIKEFLLKILSVTDNAYKLLQNLLEWSSSQTNAIEFNPEKFDFYDIVNENIELLKGSARTKGIEIISKIPQKTIVYADINMIRTIVRNLISNAIKFTFKNGLINISAKEENNKIVVLFADTGIGISKSNIKKLFKISDKFKTDGTEKEKGTGLGLILCKEFVERHNGNIWVESEEGSGSKFYISLPLVSI